MRLHHQPRSRSTRVLWLLEELGIPFDLTVMSRDVKQTPEYWALHPLGRAPVLEEEGGPVFESAALILHIADQNLEAALIAPLGSHARALQYQWCFFAMTESEVALMEIARQLWSDSANPDPGIIERAAARFVTAAGVIEAALGDDDYLVGDSFSVADIVVGSVLGFARSGELTELPAGVVRYVDLLEARPARQRAVAVSLPVS
jgi:glutathione S-transferase